MGEFGLHMNKTSTRITGNVSLNKAERGELITVYGILSPPAKQPSVVMHTPVLSLTQSTLSQAAFTNSANQPAHLHPFQSLAVILRAQRLCILH